MNKTARRVAGAGALAVAIGFTAIAWHDNNANEAATYAALHPAITPTPATAKTPAQTACLQAIVDADAVIDLTADGYDILGDALEAAGKNDDESVGAAGRNMQLFNKRLAKALAEYRESRDACKAAGR